MVLKLAIFVWVLSVTIIYGSNVSFDTKLKGDVLDTRTIINITRSVLEFFKVNCLSVVDFEQDSHARYVFDVQKYFSAGLTYARRVNSQSYRAGNNQIDNCNQQMLVINKYPYRKNHSVSFTHTRYAPREIWLLFLNGDADMKDLLSNADIPFNSEAFVVQSGASSARVSEVFRVADEMSLQVSHFCTWSAETGLKTPNNPYLYSRRSGFFGKVFKTTNLEFKGVSTFEEPAEMYGYFDTLWSILEESMNFSSLHTIPKDGGYGALRNGSWTGMVGALVRREADITSVPIVAIHHRAQYVQFLTTIFKSQVNCHIAVPGFQGSMSALATPFSKDLWTALAVSYLAITLINILMLNANRGRSTTNHDPLTIFGAIFCAQGNHLSSTTPSYRMLVVFTYILGIFICVSYTNSIKSTLTIRKVDIPFRSLEEFNRKKSYDLGMLQGSFLFSIFQQNKGGLLQEVYDKSIMSDLKNIPRTRDEAFKRVCDTKFCFLEIHEMLLETNIGCSIVALQFPELNQNAEFGYAVPKDSSYVRLFNRNILKLRSGGIIQKLRDDYSQRLSNKLKDRAHPIELRSVVPLLQVLVVGVIVSLVLLLVELVLVNTSSPVAGVKEPRQAHVGARGNRRRINSKRSLRLLRRR